MAAFVRRDLVSWSPVYALVKRIPRGRVTTYGQIARALKLPGGARTAGRAMAACPAGRGIPWHRVVGAAGVLLLREPDVSLQRKLLEAEGVRVAGKQIAEFQKHEWRIRKTTGRSGARSKKLRRFLRS
jgi:methylated-DNA-protein-cysteine methyltransferase-like protein